MPLITSTAFAVFNSIVGVAGLGVGIAGVAAPDPLEERFDEVDRKLDALKQDIADVRADINELGDTILDQFDTVTKRDIRAALAKMETAAVELDDFRRKEVPTAADREKVSDLADAAMNDVLAQVAELPDKIDPEVATVMVNAVTYAVAVRLAVALEVEDGAIGKTSIREGFAKAADMLEDIRPIIEASAEDYVEVTDVVYDWNWTYWARGTVSDAARKVDSAVYNAIEARTDSIMDYRETRAAVEKVYAPFFVTNESGLKQHSYEITDKIMRELGVTSNTAGRYEGTITVQSQLSDSTTTTEYIGLNTLITLDLSHHLNAAVERAKDAVVQRDLDAMGLENLNAAAAQLRDLADGVDRVGTAGANRIDGTDGNDLLAGLAGADTISAGGDADKVEAGSGADLVFGGAGGDVLFGQDGNDQLFGGRNSDRLLGGLGDDLLDGGRGADMAEGGRGRDVIRLDEGNDGAKGGRGADVILGGTGRDTLLGGAGNDTIGGGRGADVIKGAAGNDALRGGAGPDTFLFAPGHGRDVISDFDSALDSLAFEGLAPNAVRTIQSGDDTRVTYGADEILLRDTDATTVDIDFL